MTQVKLIKREEGTRQEKPSPLKTATPHATVQEWVRQYQTAKTNNARATFAALFVTARIG